MNPTNLRFVFLLLIFLAFGTLTIVYFLTPDKNVGQTNPSKYIMELGKFANLFMPTPPPEENSTTAFPNLPLSKEDIAAFIESQNPNLPLSYWQQQNAEGHKMELNGSCAKMPDPLRLRYNNKYWQEVVTSSLTLYLYAAYLDDRERNTEGPVVRLLGMTDKLKPMVPIFCQLWFENSTQPVLSEVTSFQWLWIFWGEGEQGNAPSNDLQPYLLTCPVPAEHAERIPILVSVAEGACDTATALLKVIYDKAEKGKKKFAVCVKDSTCRTISR